MKNNLNELIEICKEYEGQIHELENKIYETDNLKEKLVLVNEISILLEKIKEEIESYKFVEDISTNIYEEIALWKSLKDFTSLLVFVEEEGLEERFNKYMGENC
ncbi:MAG: hypothetical protein ACRC57_00490 [Sarcina sp.]